MSISAAITTPACLYLLMFTVLSSSPLIHPSATTTPPEAFPHVFSCLQIPKESKACLYDLVVNFQYHCTMFKQVILC